MRQWESTSSSPDSCSCSDSHLYSYSYSFAYFSSSSSCRCTTERTAPVWLDWNIGQTKRGCHARRSPSAPQRHPRKSLAPTCPGSWDCGRCGGLSGASRGNRSSCGLSKKADAEALAKQKEAPNQPQKKLNSLRWRKLPALRVQLGRATAAMREELGCIASML